jgi:hypothetical protein
VLPLFRPAPPPSGPVRDRASRQAFDCIDKVRLKIDTRRPIVETGPPGRRIRPPVRVSAVDGDAEREPAPSRDRVDRYVLRKRHAS